MKVKITDKQKKRIRWGLWIAGLCWGAYFLVYAFVVFGRAVLPWLVKTYTGWSLWASAVFYIIVALTAVAIFFWFFIHLMRRKK